MSKKKKKHEHTFAQKMSEAENLGNDYQRQKKDVVPCLVPDCLSASLEGTEILTYSVSFQWPCSLLQR